MFNLIMSTPSNDLLSPLMHGTDYNTVCLARNLAGPEDATPIVIEQGPLDDEVIFNLVYSETGEPAYGYISYPMQDFTWESIIDVNSYTGEFAEYL